MNPYEERDDDLKYTDAEVYEIASKYEHDLAKRDGALCELSFNYLSLLHQGEALSVSELRGHVLTPERALNRLEVSAGLTDSPLEEVATALACALDAFITGERPRIWHENGSECPACLGEKGFTHMGSDNMDLRWEECDTCDGTGRR